MLRACRAGLVALMAAMLCLLVGCGSVDVYLEAPEKQAFENVALSDPFGSARAVGVSGVDIVMDTTDSMAGFAQCPAIDGKTAFVRSMDKLIYAASSYSRDANIRYFRSDAVVKAIPKELFLDYAAPAFYVPRTWYTARNMDEKDIADLYGKKNIAEAIKAADPSRVTVIITDLFENRNSNEELIREIKTKYLAQGGTAAVLALRSEFDGKVYDIFENDTDQGVYYHGAAGIADGATPPTIADIGKWESAVRAAGPGGAVDMEKLSLARLKDASPAYRPFYMLFLGEEDVVQTFVRDYINDLRKMEGTPVTIGEPPLMFEKKEQPMLIGTDGAGRKLTLDDSGEKPFEVIYVSYLEPKAKSDSGLETEARQLPENLWAYMSNEGSGVAFETKVPLTLIASENAGSDERLLQDLYSAYELAPEVLVYKLDGSTIYLEDVRKRHNAFRGEVYPLSQNELEKAFRFDGGSFALDGGNKFRANGELSMWFDPFQLPEELNNCRVEVRFYLRQKGAVVVESDPLEHYPWATGWMMRVDGQSAQMWNEFPQMRDLNATINIDSFARGLIRSKEEVETIDPDPFPSEKLVNALTLDLLLKR